MKAAEPGRTAYPTLGTSSNAKVENPLWSVGDGNDPTRSAGGIARNLNLDKYPANDRRSDTTSGTETTFAENPRDDVTPDLIETTDRHSDVIKTVTSVVSVTGVGKRAEKGATDVSATIAPTNPINPRVPSVKSDTEKQLAPKGGRPRWQTLECPPNI